MITRPLPYLALALLAATLIGGCAITGAAVVSASAAPTLDPPATDTDLDRGDLDQVFSDAQRQLLRSSFFARASSVAQRTTLGVFPLRNETAEPIDAELQALLDKMETDLVGRDVFLVVRHGQQAELIAEVERKSGLDVSDPGAAAEYGRQLGVAYLLTGKIRGVVDGAEGSRRVQYTVSLQVIDVQTGRVAWTTDWAITTAGLTSRSPGTPHP